MSRLSGKNQSALKKHLTVSARALKTVNVAVATDRWKTLSEDTYNTGPSKHRNTQSSTAIRRRFQAKQQDLPQKGNNYTKQTEKQTNTRRTREKMLNVERSCSFKDFKQNGLFINPQQHHVYKRSEKKLI